MTTLTALPAELPAIPRPLMYEDPDGLTEETIFAAVNAVADSLLTSDIRRVLLVPPDITRSHSGAGILTRYLFSRLNPAIDCDILPALGSHRAMTRSEQITFFGGDIPAERFLLHDWRADTVELGYVPATLMASLSGGAMRDPVPVEINRRVVQGGYDLILSLGQVVPHEVAGMANYTKNMLVGCGGRRMINASHLLSVVCGGNWMGLDHSPVRQLLDYAQAHFLEALPIQYMLTVTTPRPDGGTTINGLYIGGGRTAFEKAVQLSQQLNVTHTGKPVETCVVSLPSAEFRTAWLGNKAIYRTRHALAPGAQLIILAPGFERFGEDIVNDEIIRRYGYRGRDPLLALFEHDQVLQDNQGAFAHLIHGSSDGLFRIIYCTDPAYAGDIQAAGYEWGDIAAYTAQYAGLSRGWNRIPGSSPHQEAYYIDNPALGLWVI